jgi:ATP-dependent Zn protease
VDGAFQRARLLLLQNRDLLVEGARRLLEKETLSDGELAEVLGKVRTEVPQAA